MKVTTYGPDEKWPKGVILPTQTHGNNIIEIITGNEDLSDCDGIWNRVCSSPGRGGVGGVRLGIKTADCAPIVFYDDQAYGIIHAGWRGLCNGIIEKMLSNFDNVRSRGQSFDNLSTEGATPSSPKSRSELKVWVGPILPQFEIQKDFCYDTIYAKFGDQFFTPPPTPPLEGEEKRYLFDFKAALQSILPMAEFDGRSTYDEKTLASWRRDHNERRNLSIVFPSGN